MDRKIASIIELLNSSPGGLTRKELLARLREQVPYLQATDVERTLRRATDWVFEDSGRWYAHAFLGEQPSPVENGDTYVPARFSRLVAFDLECVVRPIVKEPYRQQHIFQIGAVRFGRDADWNVEQHRFEKFVALHKKEDEFLIYNEELRARYHKDKRPSVEVLQEFHEFCAGCDALVAYNGVAHDFRLLQEEWRRQELPPLWGEDAGPRLVDALYLAQALWPLPPRQHRLEQLLQRLRVDVVEMRWHDALDDSRMVVKLLEYGATEFLPTLGGELVSLLVSAGEGSDAWELLFSLAGLEPDHGRFDTRETAGILCRALDTQRSRKRLRVTPFDEDEHGELEGSSHPEPTALDIPDRLRGQQGKLDIDKLVGALKGPHSEAREAQRCMVSKLREWIRDGTSALIEAPTGTGKSYAILAAALDWLAADVRNKVVISTFTKQLQSQLAGDIEALSEAAMPQLVGAADLVKGATNRLSVRALVLALSDLTVPVGRRQRGRRDFPEDQRYRDLVIYLALRFVAEGKPAEEWEARSVDRVDVPVFFDEYCPRRLSLYLASLSQAENEEYQSGEGLGGYTANARESLKSRRLVVANHALLLAHIDDFEEIGERTLLFVDEAHELENAATSALSPQFDFGMFADLAGSAKDWVEDQRALPGTPHLRDAVEKLERYLEDDRLAQAARRAFDTAERDPLGRSVLRTVTVASPLQGDAFVRPMETLANELHDAYRTVRHVRQAWRGVHSPEDPFERDRLEALRARTEAVDAALTHVIADIDAVLGREGGGPADPADVGEERDLVPVGEGEEQEQLVVVDEDEPERDDDRSGQPREPLRLERPNRVVFAEELEEYHPDRPYAYRFRLTSSPIELAREDPWQRFCRRFARAYYVSATLRVAGSWDFMRRRLALPAGQIETIALDSPFDAGTQAELVCFEDFPSWSEHAEAAMRTVAHQLTGYAAELVDGPRNGVMVLTTSRAAAAGIFDHLARLRVEQDRFYPLISAGLEGNQRAVETFKSEGGVLVGTRGLWQGVDIDEPERLRLVWINKLPFAPFADPVIAARLQLEVEQADLRGEEDPEGFANERYYLPLAALALRQAVGRLIRSSKHHGVVVISDRKLAGPTRLRRLYRSVFLGSLDPGMKREDPETGEAWLGNVCTMQEGWRRIFGFYARHRILEPARSGELRCDARLEQFTELPETLRILEQELSAEEEAAHRGAGTLGDELVVRAARIAGHLNSARGPVNLKPKQEDALRALAEDKDLLAILPTGYGKSYVFQLPALALPGVTVVVSPLVSLMTDQALELNRTIGGRVRALVGPMRESNSRTGKSEIEEELRGVRSHGIKLVYLSPERLAQRQFQEWIRAGVKGGIVRRIALDEAHTFVQWGDDFRPSIRRAEDFLSRLKGDYPELRLMALTATANASVRDGLRRAIFGLAQGESRPDFAFVQANPLRPELALYRRVMPRHLGGQTSVSGLVEGVVDALEGHAIFYCLTVRQVETLYAHLRDYLQGHKVNVYRYHGRLTDAEKTGVANAFRSTPPKGEEDYQRMVVVATSAFGLGIDRPDIRAVFCVSPPTDVASLYQQLGRAGRDRAARPGEPGEYTAGLALTYPRAQRTIRFMTQQRLDKELLARIAGRILASSSPISSSRLAMALIDEDAAGGRLTRDEAAKVETLDTYQTGVLRVLAELSLQRVVTDLGDFPHTVEVHPGEMKPDTKEMLQLVEAITDQRPRDGRVEVAALHAQLASAFGEDYPDPGTLWAALLELHTLGYLDVSQRPNREQLTALEFHSREFPERLLDGLERHNQRVQEEVGQLWDWFGSHPDCCNEGFRAYFSAEALPQGTCADDDCRCTSCWQRAGLPAGAREPRLYHAFRVEKPRSASASAAGRRRSEVQLEQLVLQLLWQNDAGLVENIMWAVLRGDDHYYSRSAGQRKPLWPKLLLSRVHGRKPGLRQADLHAALLRLVSAGTVTRVGAAWYRLARDTAQ